MPDSEFDPNNRVFKVLLALFALVIIALAVIVAYMVGQAQGIQESRPTNVAKSRNLSVPTPTSVPMSDWEAIAIAADSGVGLFENLWEDHIQKRRDNTDADCALLESKQIRAALMHCIILDADELATINIMTLYDTATYRIEENVALGYYPIVDGQGTILGCRGDFANGPCETLGEDVPSESYTIMVKDVLRDLAARLE